MTSTVQPARCELSPCVSAHTKCVFTNRKGVSTHTLLTSFSVEHSWPGSETVTRLDLTERKQSGVLPLSRLYKQRLFLVVS